MPLSRQMRGLLQLRDVIKSAKHLPNLNFIRMEMLHVHVVSSGSGRQHAGRQHGFCVNTIMCTISSRMPNGQYPFPSKELDQQGNPLPQFETLRVLEGSFHSYIHLHLQPRFDPKPV